ncbi:MAG: FAD-dependent oxidoreductase, partial [Gemmataceae bacterium]|nr:FAD-dependent oxidoreductase [Gemmataceae bacterium]
KSSPITSVHLWYDRPLFDAPHEVIVDGLCQWVFRRGEVSPGEHYHQVVISAAGDIAGLGIEEIARRVTDELKTIYPPARDAKCLRSRVVIEKAATFSAVPGVDQYRPGPRCSVPNLYLAGDWTDTGWPATMEGAVRSGYRAAECIAAVNYCLG